MSIDALNVPIKGHYHVKVSVFKETTDLYVYFPLSETDGDMKDLDQTENAPLLVSNSNIEDRNEGRKHSLLCALLFVCGVTALCASVIICHFLYFKYVIGKDNQTKLS